MKASLNSNQIKMIAILAMTIDHIAWLMFPGYQSDVVPIIMHIIGRITCPIMCYFIAEGYHYTKDISKYTRRLFAFAFLSRTLCHIISICAGEFVTGKIRFA